MTRVSLLMASTLFCATLFAGVGISSHPIDTAHIGRLWPIRKIPYYVEPSIPAVIQDMIDDARAAWVIADLPINFEPVTVPPPGAYVHFVAYPNRHCDPIPAGEETELAGDATKIGYDGNKVHYVCLNADPRILTKGVILHELGHVIGLGHEHIHCDAGRYISQFPDEPFEKCQPLVSESANFIMLTDYDIESIMHYRPKATGGILTPFGNLHALTLGFKPANLGIVQFLSSRDEEAIKKLYPPP